MNDDDLDDPYSFHMTIIAYVALFLAIFIAGWAIIYADVAGSVAERTIEAGKMPMAAE